MTTETEVLVAAETAKALIAECGMTKLEAVTLLMAQRKAAKCFAAGWFLSKLDMAEIVSNARHHAEIMLEAA